MADERMPGLMPTKSTRTGERTRSRSFLKSGLLCRGGERLAFFDHVRRHDAGRRRPPVLGVWDRAARNEKRLPDTKGHGRLSFLLEQQLAVEDVADLFAGMGVPARRCAGLKFGDGRHRL